MVPDVKLVVRLQDLDNRIEELRREITSLPKHIAAIEKTLEGHIRKVEADKAAMGANQRDRKQIELEVQGQQSKVSKLKEQMMEARTNEQYRAFQHEIEYCEAAVRKAEDRILDLMGDSERLERNLRSTEAALSAERRQVEEEKGQARERTAEDQKALEAVERERQALVSELTPDVYGSYERIRKKRKGRAVAEALDGRCSACNMALRLQFFQELRRNDKVMFCESCGRILYYTPPEILEDTPQAEHLETGP